MIKKLINWYYRRKTKDLTMIPLFTMTFNYRKWKEHGNENSCAFYTLHPELITDEFLKENLKKCVDHIRETYDMENFARVFDEK